MNTQDQNHIDYHLLGKYLSGEATPEEAITVDEWLQFPVNKKQFNQIEKIWNGLPGDTRHQLPDRKAAWNELQPLLPVKRTGKMVRFFSKWYAAAASVVIIVSVLLFVTQYRSTGQELIVRGPYQKIVRDSLPDGTRFVLKQNGILQYAKTFNTTTRELQLQGESFFDVTHNKEKPFIISVGDVKIKVIGTSFNVKQTTNPATVEVQVQSGLVKMFTDKKELAVVKGQTGIYFKEQDTFEIKGTVDVNSFSYATRMFEFENLSMRELIPYLEDAYGVNIVVRNDRIFEFSLSGQFNEIKFNQILEILAQLVPFKYTAIGNTYYLE